MKTLRNVLIGLVAILIIGYIGLAYYAHNQARHWANQTTSQITNSNPNITAINYQSISASPLRLIKHELELHKVTVKFAQQKLPPVVIDQVTVIGFDQFNKQQPGNFSVHIKGAHFDHLMQELKQEAGSQQNLISEVLPKNFNPGASLDWDYQAKSHQLHTKFNIHDPTTTYLTYNITFSDVKFGQLRNIQAVESGLQSSYIKSIHYKLNINSGKITLTPKTTWGAIVQHEANLHTTSVHINGHGQYSDHDKVSYGQVNMKLGDLFELHLHSKIHYYERLHLQKLATYYQHMLDQNADDYDFKAGIASFKLQYHDLGLLPTAYSIGAQISGANSPQQLQHMLINPLLHIAHQYPSKHLQATVNQITKFISHPKTLTISMSPAKPIPNSYFQQFGARMQKQATQMQQQMQNHPKPQSAKQQQMINNQREQQMQQYQQQMAQQIDNFFQKTNLEVNANG